MRLDKLRVQVQVLRGYMAKAQQILNTVNAGNTLINAMKSIF